MTEHEILGFYVDTNRRIFTTFSANNAGLLWSAMIQFWQNNQQQPPTAQVRVQL